MSRQTPEPASRHQRHGARPLRGRLLPGLLLVLLLGIWVGSDVATAGSTSPGQVATYPLPGTSSQSGGYANSIASGPDGDLWVAERSGIVRLDPAGHVTEFPLATGSIAERITAGPDGAMWFTEYGADRIGRISATGALTEYALPAGHQPLGIAAGPDGNLWFTEFSANQIGRITPRGQITEFTDATMTGDREGPADIAAGPGNKMWFTDQGVGRIGTIDTGAGGGVAGTIGRFNDGNANSQPNAIIRGPDGNMWFTDVLDQSLNQITPTGTTRRFALNHVPEAAGLTVGADGNFWLTERGRYLAGVGLDGTEHDYTPTSGSNTINALVTGPDGNLWITDPYANQVDVFGIGAPAANQVPPSLHGPAQEGTPEFCDGAAWSVWDGHGPDAIAYAWLRDGSVISGAIRPSYTPVTADVGHALSCRTTAHYAEQNSFAAADSPPVTPTAATVVATEYSSGLRPSSDLWEIARAGSGTTLSFADQGGGAPALGTVVPPSTITENPSGFSGADSVVGIVDDALGNRWIASGGSANAIVKVAPDGTVTRYTAGITAGRHPYDITVGPDQFGPGGAIWFTEYSDSTVTPAIGRLDPSTGAITEFPLPGTATVRHDPSGITDGPDGAVWFTDLGDGPTRTPQIGRITVSGAVTEFPTGDASRQPYRIVTGADGRLWFTDQPITATATAAIGAIVPSTGAISRYTAGLASGSFPSGIALGPDGNVWFADPGGGGAIGRVTSTGTITEFSAGLNPGASPVFITSGGDGKLWFTDGGTTQAIGTIAVPAGSGTTTTVATTTTSGTTTSTPAVTTTPATTTTIPVTATTTPATTTTTPAATTTTGTTAPATTTTAPPPPPGPSGAPDLSLNASHHDPFRGAPGESYRLQVTNQGTATASGLRTITAHLPAGVRYASASSGWSCLRTDDGVRCQDDGAPLVAGAVSTLDLSVTVDPRSSGGRARFELLDSDPTDLTSTDKQATDDTTVLTGGVQASLNGPLEVVVGATTTLELKTINHGSRRLDGGLTAEFALPAAAAGGVDITPSASGPGWLCSTVSAMDQNVVHCSLGPGIDPDTAAPSLRLALRATGQLAGGGYFTIRFTERSSSGTVLVEPVDDHLKVVSANVTRAGVGLTLTGPPALNRGGQPFDLRLANAGSGSTTGPTRITLDLPVGVDLLSAAGDGWACDHQDRRVGCETSATLAPGNTAAPIILSLAGVPGYPGPARISATATASDAAGPVSVTSTLSLAEPAPQLPRPVVIQRPDLRTGGVPGTAGYSLAVANQGSGVAAGGALHVEEQLPPGVSVDARGPGWSCASVPGHLSCSLSDLPGGTGLAPGHQSPPLHVTLTGAGAQAGSVLPTPAQASLPAGAAGNVVSASVPTIAINGATAAQVTVRASIDQNAAPPGAVVHAVVGLANEGQADATGPQLVALLLPQDLALAGVPDAPTPVTDLPSPGLSGSNASAAGPPGMQCVLASHGIVCLADGLRGRGLTTITVPLRVRDTAAGDERLLVGGLQPASTGADRTAGSLLHQSATTLETAGASALSDLNELSVHVLAFTPQVGADQRVPVASETAGQVTPTSVSLDGSSTQSVGRPLTFAWVQIAGPRVTWAPPQPGTEPLPPRTPGLPVPPVGHAGQDPSLARFPAGALGNGPVGYGPRPAFTVDDPRALTAPATLQFKLLVTDGDVVRSAVSTVEVDPLPAAPPEAPPLCFWDLRRNPKTTPQDCIGTTTPAAGDLIVVGARDGYRRDRAGHPLTYAWSFDPTPPVPSTDAEACSQPDRTCFRWPARTAVVTATATITNGQQNGVGGPEQAVAVASAGSTPAAPTVSVDAPAGPLEPGRRVTLQALGGASNAGLRYSWTQTAGPAPPGGLQTQDNAASFVVPAPPPGVDRLSFRVTVTAGAGAASASTTRDVDLTVLPAGALTATLVAVGGTGSVAPGATLALRAGAGGGAGSGYSYSFSTSAGTITQDSRDRSAATLTAPSSPGLATVTVTVGDGQGGETRTSLPIEVGSVPAPSTSSADPCSGGGPIATVLAQLQAHAPAAIKLGPVTVSLGQPQSNGPTPSCSDFANGISLAFDHVSFTVGPLTISGASAQLDKGGVTLKTGDVSAPASWNLGTGSISTPIVLAFGSSPQGGITWTHRLPWLTPPTAATDASTSVTLRGDGTIALAATVPLLGGTAALTATIPTGHAGFSASVKVTGGTADGSSGTVAVAADNSVTYNVDLSLSGLAPIAGVTVKDAKLQWDRTGIELAANALIGDSVPLALKGIYVDSDHWSATLSASAPPTNPSWLPAGVSLVGAILTGNVSDTAGQISFDVQATVPNPWTLQADGHDLVKVDHLALEFANTQPPAACASLFGSGDQGRVFLRLSGHADITLPGGLAPLSVTTQACVVPGAENFVLTTSSADGYKPLASAPVTFDKLSLTVARRSGNLSVSAGGQVTVAGVHAAGTLSFLPGRGFAVVAALPDLSKLGLPVSANSAGAVVFSSTDIDDLSQAPSELFANTGIDQASLVGVRVPQNHLTVAATLPLPDSLRCTLDQTLYHNPCAGQNAPTTGDQAPASAAVTADIGSGSPSLTLSLSAGPNGLRVFKLGNDTGPNPDYVSVTLRSISLHISLDGSLSIGAGADLMFPTPGATGGESRLSVDAQLAIDIKGPSITFAATVGPDCQGAHGPTSSNRSALCDFLGVRGLDFKSLSVQFGVNFGAPTPTPTFGFAAGVTALPCTWAGAIHYVQDGCDPSGRGVPNPDTPLAEPLSLAVEVSTTGPIFALQLGIHNQHPVLQFGNLLNVDDASLVIAPTGGTIGAGPNAVHFDPGLSLDFDAQVLSVPVALHAHVDPSSLSVTAHASVGAVDLAGLHVDRTAVDLDVGPTIGIKLSVSGGLTIPGGPRLDVNAKLVATPSDKPSFDLVASGGNVGLGSVLTLQNLQLSAHGELVDGGLPQLDLEGTGTGTVLGQQLTLAGGIAVTPILGITGANLFAAGRLSVAGISLGGRGCGPAAPQGLPHDGACVGVGFDAGRGSLDAEVDATVGVAGFDVTFNGRVDDTGIDLQGSAQFSDPLDPSGQAPAETLGQLSGRLYLGTAASLANLTVTDPSTGDDLPAQNGDFLIQGSGGVSLAGLSVSGAFDFGSLGHGPDGARSFFADANLNVDALGASATVQGTFSADTDGSLKFDLIGQGAVVVDGYSLVNARLELSSNSGLSVDADLHLGPVSGHVSGNINVDDGGTLRFRVSGTGAINALGVASLQASLSIANEDSQNHPLSGVAASASVTGGAFDNLVTFSGSASFATDGSFCLGGNATVIGITGSATFCTASGIQLDFDAFGFHLGGFINGHDWALQIYVASNHFHIDPEILGTGVEIAAFWDFSFGVSSAHGLDFHIEGSADVWGHTPFGSGHLVGVSVLGTPDRQCLSTHVVVDVAGCHDHQGIHLTDPFHLDI